MFAGFNDIVNGLNRQTRDGLQLHLVEADDVAEGERRLAGLGICRGGIEDRHSASLLLLTQLKGVACDLRGDFVLEDDDSALLDQRARGLDVLGGQQGVGTGHDDDGVIAVLVDPDGSNARGDILGLADALDRNAFYLQRLQIVLPVRVAAHLAHQSGAHAETSCLNSLIGAFSTKVLLKGSAKGGLAQCWHLGAVGREAARRKEAEEKQFLVTERERKRESQQEKENLLNHQRSHHGDIHFKATHSLSAFPLDYNLSWSSQDPFYLIVPYCVILYLFYLIVPYCAYLRNLQSTQQLSYDQSRSI
eukprot:scaffold7560_cov149-Ochromonas_danica.AAC.2